jgi:tetratricopeptide (TPR) repeat protein
LARAASGLVYMAEQIEPVRRKVALKVIKAGMDTREVIARFEAERQALALMDHPNIARVLDGGATATGRPYFVMELVRGIPITDYCDQAQLSTPERLRLFIKVCQAVQHAHQKGIIHRDIKPSNVLITLHDGEPVPKVIDFGVAKAVGQRLTEKTFYTGYAQMIGTPAYMSPEQAELSGLDIDTRADIYSLGALLYELLTGATPFDKETLARAALDEMRRMIRETEPPKPSTRLRTLGDKLPEVAKRRNTEAAALGRVVQGDLDWIVMKCLEKDRRRRYETANGLAMDLRRHLADEPVTAGAPSAGYKFGKFARRHKAALAVAATIAAVLVMATGISVWQAVRAARAEALAKERLTESESITKFLTGVFRSADPWRDGRTITVAETLDRAVTNLDRDLSAQPARRAQLQTALGWTYQGLGLGRQAIPLQEKARDYYLATFGPEHPDTLAAMFNLANSYFDAGRLDEALKLREKVLPLRRKVNGPEHPDTLRAMNNLAACYFEAGRRDEALRLREELLPLWRKVNGPEHPDTLSAMGSLAHSYRAAGRLDEAVKLQEEVLQLCRKVLGPEHPDTLKAMNSLANSYRDAGRRDEALKLWEDGLRLRRKVLGPEHPATLLAINNLAVSYDQASRREEALKMREDVLPLYRKVLGSEHPDTLRAMRNLALSYDEAGRLEKALKMREDVLALYRKLMGPEHPDTLSAMGDLALSYVEAGRHQEAIALLGKACELDPKDTDASLTLATWQIWFGQDADYEATRRRVVQDAEEAVHAGPAERAAKAYCLRPSTDAALLAKVLTLAQRAVELGRTSPLLPWYQLGLGLAEYRNSQYAAAERALTLAEQTAGEEYEIPSIARLYRAMSLFRQDKPEEARKLFSQAQAQMPPLPEDENKPLVDGKPVSHDVLICWLAYKEARALLNQPRPAQP